MIAMTYDANFWVQFAAGCIVVTGGITGGIKIVHTWLTRSVAERLEELRTTTSQIRSETQSNGGSSMRDAINRVDQRTAVMEKDIQGLRSELDRHLGYHDGMSS